MRQNVKINIEQRQETREKLIELRSQNLKNKLDAAEERVETRNNVLREKVAE